MNVGEKTPQQCLSVLQWAATLSSVGDIWDMATLEEKQVLISQVFSGLFIRGGKIVAAQATPLSWMLLEAATMIRGAGRTGDDESTRTIFLHPDASFADLEALAA